MSNDLMPVSEVSRKLTLTEWGVVISLLTSAGVGIFTLGVVYAQVNQNTARLEKIEPKVEDISRRIERVDANVEFLREQADRDYHK